MKNRVENSNVILSINNNQKEFSELIQQLDKLKYDVKEVSNIDSALKIIKNNQLPPSMIIFSMDSPPEACIQFCKKISIKYKQKVPIIALTSKISEKLIDDFFNAGGYDIIRRPILPLLLFRIIKKTLTIFNEKNLDSLIIESTSDGICLIDKNCTIVKVNTAFENIFNIKSKDIVNKKCHDAFSCEDCFTENCQLDRALKNKLKTKTEYKSCKVLSSKDVYCTLTVSTFNDINGNVAGIIKTFSDMRARRLIEDQLNLKSSIVESSLTGSNYVTIDKKISYANNKFLEMWGYSSLDEIKGKSAYQLFKNRQDADKVESALLSQGKWAGEFTAIRKDKSTFICQNYSTAVKDTSGSFIGYQSSNIDITAQKKTQLALKKSETRFRELFNKMWSGIAVYTPLEDGSNFIFRDINKAGEKLSHVRKKDIIGKLLTNVFPSVDEFGLLKILKEVSKSGIPQHYPITYYHDNKHQAWFENYIFRLPSKEVVAIYNDVTKEKQKETEIISAKNNLEKLSNKLHKNLIDTVVALSNTVEYRDNYTTGHSRNVAQLACDIAAEMGLQPEKIGAVKMAGELHDIGKIAIPLDILSKNSKLTDEEFNLIKTHSKVGYELIKDISFAQPIARMVLEHHERLDGSGYPDGKKEDEILLESKILAVADVVEAMSLPRPYRKALGIKIALEEIIKNSGIKFDSDVVDACVKLFRKKNYKFD